MSLRVQIKGQLSVVKDSVKDEQAKRKKLDVREPCSEQDRNMCLDD